MRPEDCRTFRTAVSDLNGDMRGKRLPATDYDKIGSGSLRMPFSVLNVDIWGTDIEDSPLVFESGDQDGVLMPTGRGPVFMPWLEEPTFLEPVWMFDDSGAPFDGDPRHALQHVLNKYAERGWSVVAATELEFYLVDDSGQHLTPPDNPVSGRPLDSTAILSLRELDAFDAFFSDLYAASEQMGLKAQAAISEAGIGQFEINLVHTDAMRMADNTWLFKALVRGMARKHGFAATFMAKPFPDEAGNGLHMHFSVVDKNGNNVFDDGNSEGSETLLQAVAGCLAAMRASTLVLAPHSNSYDRLIPGAHAPTDICWGYENRTAAIRIPSGDGAARRIEHRVAGGDTNPYLMMATVLGSALFGIENQLTPPDPITGNAYETELPQLLSNWSEAIELFEQDEIIAEILPKVLIENLVMTKRQELLKTSEIEPAELWKTYLETV